MFPSFGNLNSWTVIKRTEIMFLKLLHNHDLSVVSSIKHIRTPTSSPPPRAYDFVAILKIFIFSLLFHQSSIATHSVIKCFH